MCKENITLITLVNPGYVERLRALNEQLKARCSVLEQSCISAQGFAEKALYDREALFGEVQALKRQTEELGRQNIALAAQAEQSELLERQLAAADRENAELEAALRLAQMPADSQSNVIDLLERTAA